MGKDIGTAIRLLAGTHSMPTVYVFDATVTGAVDVDNRMVQVTKVGGESSNIIDVRLMPSVDDGVFIYPTLNSTVTVLMTDYSEPIIIAYSGVDSITWLGGEYGGVPIATHPTDSKKGLFARIKKIEDKLNHFITIYDGHTHKTTCGAGAGTALLVSGGDIESNLSPQTALSDIIHPNITH